MTGRARAALALVLSVAITDIARAGVARAAAPDEYVDLGQEVLLRISGRPTFYAMAPKGGLDAISATDGKVVWHSNRAAVPLFTRAGKLVALQPKPTRDGRQQLIVLDAETGAVQGELPPLPPEAVLGETLTQRGSISARPRGDHDVVLWHSLRLPSGTALPPHGQQIAGVPSDGAVVVDVAARTLTPTSEPRPGPRTHVTGHEADQFELLPFDVDGLHVQIAPQRSSAGMTVVMHRSQNGKALADAVIGDRWSLMAPIVSSRDLRHVAQFERRDLPPMAERESYTVAVTAVATGAKVGAPYTSDDPLSGFIVQGNQLFFRSIPRHRGRGALPDRIGAQDLGHGQLIFARPIGALRYDGRCVLAAEKNP